MTSIPETHLLAIRFVDDYIVKGGVSYPRTLKLSDLDIWAEIKSQTPQVRAEICLWACSSGLKFGRYGANKLPNSSYKIQLAEFKLGNTLLRSTLPFTETQLSDLIKWCTARRSLEWENPVSSILRATERSLEGNAPGKELSKSLSELLKKCRDDMQYSRTEVMRKLTARVEMLLDPDIRQQAFYLPKGPWSDLAKKDLASLDEKSLEHWKAVFAHGASAKGSKPSKKWLKEGSELIENIGVKNFQSHLCNWMEQTQIDPENPDPAVDILKGLVWLIANNPNDEMALSVGRFAENCFVKVAGVGARSVKLGNACCVTLMNMPDNPTAIAELVRLRGKIKYPSVRKTIQKKLETIADKKSVTVAELEDASLPEFGFNTHGQYIKNFGDYTATITLIGNKATLSWADQNGKARKTVPAAVKTNFKPELGDLKRLAKDMNSVVTGQINAIEQSYINDRSWDYAAWKTRYLDHPVRRNITQSLLWFITDGTTSVSVLPTDKGLEDLSGKIHKPSKTASIKLWHPLFEAADTIVAWRERIEALEILQPFKQAHREIYVVTDAERQTEIYSNRFAAHILRQHQFKALCQARGWTYTLQGMWDSWNIPQKRIPAFGIIVEYSVEMIADEEESGYGVPLYLTADQVRFLSHDLDQINIVDVPPIVFSEAMRDVDLFVAVTSVANDPNWTDGGPHGRFGNYWQSYSFGDLGETAKTRREMIAKLVPKLAIADKLEVDTKFLKVKGKRHDYKIHFGSGNIMIMPGNKYLCIVKAPPSKSTDKVHLPFAGDNLLTIILSKAHMLVNDDKITDKTILSQLR